MKTAFGYIIVIVFFIATIPLVPNLILLIATLIDFIDINMVVLVARTLLAFVVLAIIADKKDIISSSAQLLIDRLMPQKKKSKVKKSNFAYAELSVSDRVKSYIASSLDSMVEFEDITIKGKSVMLCNNEKSIKNHLPMKRLNSSFEFEVREDNNLGFAKTYLTCAERKILAQIIEEHGRSKLAESELFIYSRYEPCLYCYNVLSELKEEGLTIELCYENMLVGTELYDELKFIIRDC